MNDDKEARRIRENSNNAAVENQLVINMYLRLWQEFDYDDAREYAATIKEFNCLV